MMKNQLNPLSIPLQGKHLIEASAGTGKTYNITRIYVRLLLERSLSVKEILVMTFTEAATEEIRERISKFIVELLHNWDTNPCDFSKSMIEKVGSIEAKQRLEIAHLEIDLAAIFTIHGFCQRILSRFGLSMSINQQSDLQDDMQHIKRMCIGECLHALRADSQSYSIMQNKNWHDPDKFLFEFGNFIGKPYKLQTINAEALISSQHRLFESAWQSIKANRKTLSDLIERYFEVFMQGLKKPTAKNNEKLRNEINQTLSWLRQSTLIDNPALIHDWLLGKVGNESILPKAFTAIFSKARRKNMAETSILERPASVSDTVSAETVLFNEYEVIKERIYDNGLIPEKKKILKTSLAESELNEIVVKTLQNINTKFEKTKSEQKIFGYDDLISFVAKGLNEADPELLNILRTDYPAALIDEFQDTDAEQYSIFSKIYHVEKTASSNLLLVMIGDPKQAVYSFRGGDIFTYLKAANDADYVWNMSTNYRSKEDLIQAYNRIFYAQNIKNENLASTRLFDFDIEYKPVLASELQNENVALLDPEQAPEQAHNPMVFVCAHAPLIHSEKPNKRFDEASKTQQQYDILNWCAQEVKRLLAKTTISLPSLSESPTLPEDIAILVRNGKQAKMVKRVFDEHQLKTVYLSEKSPLFASQECLHIYWLLCALYLSTTDNVRRAFSTGLLNENMPAEKINELLLDDDAFEWEEVYKRIFELAAIWKNKGVFAVLQTCIQSQCMKHEQLERSLTNYMHLAELLAQAEIKNNAPIKITQWLHGKITEPTASEASQLRLESDQRLIKIVTQHKSKGLEYPVVFIPFANQVNKKKHPYAVSFHRSPQQGDDKSLTVQNAQYQIGKTLESEQCSQRETLAEDMHLLYVALTRPIFRCYMGMTSAKSFNHSAIMRALDINVVLDKEEDKGLELAAQITNSLQGNETLFSIKMTSEAPESVELKSNIKTDIPTTLLLSSPIRSEWRLTSFSALSRSLTNIASPNNIENQFAINATAQSETKEHYAFLFPKGPDAGNYLHDILENIHFSEPNFDAVFSGLVINMINKKSIDYPLLKSWVSEVLNYPIFFASNLNSVFSLSCLLPAQVLKESEFYYPINTLAMTAFVDIVNQHRDALSQHYATELPRLDIAQIQEQVNYKLEGAMHGFIDLIFENEGKYFIADYKSNYLGSDRTDYTELKLLKDISEHMYDLQYLIYSLALHRYLGASIESYSFTKHFGGVCYLYLRGMHSAEKGNAQNAQSPGVFMHQIDQKTVLALDTLFNQSINSDDTEEMFDDKANTDLHL